MLAHIQEIRPSWETEWRPFCSALTMYKPTSKTGPPRFDAMDRLLHRFHEPLQLLWMLSPARGKSPWAPTAREPSPDFLSQWRTFLDALSYLCDFQHGGKTVSSIAAESLPDGNRFWLACRHPEALSHLAWLLKLLETALLNPELDRSGVVQSIATTSIFYGRDRVKHYRKRLSEFTAKACASTPPAILAGLEELTSALVKLASHHNPEDLCLAAVAFAQSHCLDDAIASTTHPDEPSQWSLVRHYLVRLRSWHQAAAAVVKFARWFPAPLQNHSVSWLELPPATRMLPGDAKTTLTSALKRMLPSKQQNRASDLYQAMETLRTFDFDQAFRESYGSERLSLTVHPEVFLLEHFYEQRLRFVQNDRYVGCSKPSCYCCSLYMRFHPGNPVLRPSHGTAWVTWSPPLLSRCDVEGIRSRNLFIMNRVIEHLRRDVLNEIEDRFPRRERLPDSTSGVVTIGA